MHTSQSPLAILVHGAWHGAWCWAALQAQLDSRGIPSLAIDLPGHGASTQPLADLYGDAAAVKDLVASLDRPVVLVGHSYGGAVITEASAGCRNVIHLVYLAAFALDIGEAVMSMSQSAVATPVAINSAIVFGEHTSTISPSLATAAFYGSCPATVAKASGQRLCAQPNSTFVQPVTVAGWKTIPSTYLRCTLDEAVPFGVQAEMATRCTFVETFVTDHSPFASMPDATADLIAATLSR